MSYPWIATILGLLAAPLWLVALTVVEQYRRLQEPHVVTCPENGEPAALDVTRDPAECADDPHGQLHIEGCSRWPERAPCNHLCLNQIDPNTVVTAATALR